MRNHIIILLGVLAATLGASAGCKKSGTGTSGGGGGGNWLVGNQSMMVDVRSDGSLGPGYQLDTQVTLNAIACRDTSETGQAWVVGDHGTLLYTDDAGATWTAQTPGTTANLLGVATFDSGELFVGGDASLLASADSGATWTELGDGATSYRALTTAEGGDLALAISDDGGVWSVTATGAARIATQAGAHSVGLSDAGDVAILAGAGLAKSADGGRTWAPLAVDAGLAFDEAWVADDGSAIAVGTGGAIAHIDATGVVTVEHIGTADYHTVRIADDGTGFAGGDAGATAVTHDSGATWTVGPVLAQTVRSVDQVGAGHR